MREKRRSLVLVLEPLISDPINIMIISKTNPMMPAQKNLEDKNLWLRDLGSGRVDAEISLRYSCLSI